MIAEEELWLELEAQHPEAAGIVRRRIKEDSDRNVFVAVSHPSLQRMLILSVIPEALTNVSELPNTRALRTTAEPSLTAGLVDLRITLLSDEMDRVFSPFVDDVANAVAATSSDLAAVRALLDRFEHWRRLLTGEGSEGLGRQAAQGLYGELWCLRHLAFEALGSDAVATWVGPGREDIDFQHGDVAFEVKTTIRDNPPTVEIRSERQLPPGRFARLFLVGLSLDALQAGSGQSLNNLVDEIRSCVSGSAAALVLHDKLLEYGYADVHRYRYDVPLYYLRELRVYLVGEGFPRITEQDLPVGIGRVTYTLALTACEPWRSSPDEIIVTLRNVAGHHEPGRLCRTAPPGDHSGRRGRARRCTAPRDFHTLGGRTPHRSRGVRRTNDSLLQS
jgi:hypothetical protein